MKKKITYNGHNINSKMIKLKQTSKHAIIPINLITTLYEYINAKTDKTRQ